MNCRPENIERVVACKIFQFLQITNRVSDRTRRSKARASYLRWIGKYPEIATRHGFRPEDAKPLAITDREQERFRKRLQRLIKNLPRVSANLSQKFSDEAKATGGPSKGRR